MPKSNFQQKSTPDARIRHQQVGAEQREAAALLRVRTGPECPEDNRGELLWVTNLKCGIPREREKINLPEHTASRSQDKGSEQVQRRAHRLQTGPAPLEAGGRGEGKGAGSAPRIATPTALQAGTRLGLGTRRAEGAPHPGRVRSSSSWLPEPLGPERHKKQAQLFVPRFCGTPEGWNRAQCRARSR